MAFGELGLADRVILVTGASSGIGEGIALALAAEGAVVVAAARRIERIDALAALICHRGGSALALELDILEDASIARAMDRVRAAYGRLDGLVNNAGVLGRGAAGDADATGWRRSIQTNLMGAMLVTHAALPLLKAGTNGHVVNISSIASRNPKIGSAPYTAAKAGLDAFTESLRKELAPQGMRVSLLLPGGVETEFYSHSGEVGYRSLTKGAALLLPSDIGDAVVFTMLRGPNVNISELTIRPTHQIG